ncbi:MAG: sigma-54-dependent Fis family transcriptional regulator [Deltaproteobacteria bacterium]|nr:sigma-54-dependent Fis family transcriptional regulator [Deltaproteobacteria bacterium]
MERSHILIIDDERVICEGCRLVLSGKRFSTTACYTGKAGLDAMAVGDVDLVLLDMKLPDMDGMDILKKVKSDHPSLYVIVMTGYSTVKNAVQAMKLGAFDYLTKPFTDEDLLIAVEKAVENKRLVEENLSLRKQLIQRYDFENIVGGNPAILKIFEQIRRVAPMESTVLLVGESGTGKELLAKAIHAHSKRAARQFVAADCSALSPGVVDSELFGHMKGAFTGAVQNKIGIFEAAHKGTLLLDEIANLNLDTQGKLLRVMEEGEYKPVGGDRTKHADARIIAATNMDLKSLVDDGRFRMDLYYRLNVFPILIPPLRKRGDDIPRLAYHFLRHFCREVGKKIQGFSDDALQVLVDYEWPGNVRQLKNVIERLVIMADRPYLDMVYLLDNLNTPLIEKNDSAPETHQELKEAKERVLQETYARIEKAFVIRALQSCDGNVTHAAEKVGMQRPNFHTLMKRHHVNARDFAANPPVHPPQ